MTLIKFRAKKGYFEKMKVVRIDLQGACEPMEFESKKALKEYLIDFHLQDYTKRMSLELKI
jgi:hypothetical protein